MYRIATRAYCNSLVSGAFTSDTLRCPPWSEINATGKFIINGVYATNQLVREIDLVKKEVSNYTTLIIFNYKKLTGNEKVSYYDSSGNQITIELTQEETTITLYNYGGVTFTVPSCTKIIDETNKTWTDTVVYIDYDYIADTIGELYIYGNVTSNVSISVENNTTYSNPYNEVTLSYYDKSGKYVETFMDGSPYEVTIGNVGGLSIECSIKSMINGKSGTSRYFSFDEVAAMTSNILITDWEDPRYVMVNLNGVESSLTIRSYATSTTTKLLDTATISQSGSLLKVTGGGYITIIATSEASKYKYAIVSGSEKTGDYYHLPLTFYLPNDIDEIDPITITQE